MYPSTDEQAPLLHANGENRSSRSGWSTTAKVASAVAVFGLVAVVAIVAPSVALHHSTTTTVAQTTHRLGDAAHVDGEVASPQDVQENRKRKKKRSRKRAAVN